MTLENPICNTIFDTRDLIEYIEFETSEVIEEYTKLSGREADTIDEIDICDELEREYDFTERLDDLQRVVDFAEELKDYGDYEYGEAVIHTDYFTEYTEDLLIVCGYIPKDMPSWIEIDMKATAENVKADYMEADFNGETYYMRA